MQRISRQLNVAPMTLYGYFPSRNALLQAVAAHLFAQLDLQAVRELPDWQSRIRLWCFSIREHLHTLPHMLKLISDPAGLISTWIEASDPLVEALYLAGLSPAQTTFFASWISRTLVGSLIVESSYDTAILSSAQRDTQSIFAELSPDTLARLQTMIPHLLHQSNDKQFELTLQTMLHAVEEAVHALQHPAIELEPDVGLSVSEKRN